MSKFLDLAPWDQIPYVSAPVETSFFINQTTNVQIVAGDPNRFLLIIAATAVAAGGGSISTNPNSGGNSGILLNTTTLPITITAESHGPLVTIPWFASAPAPNTMTVTVITQSFIRDPNQEPQSLLEMLNAYPTGTNGQRRSRSNGSYYNNADRWAEYAEAEIDRIAAQIQSYRCDSGWKPSGNGWVPPSRWRGTPYNGQ